VARIPHLDVRIKRARELKRWSQQRLANEIGVDRKTIDNWENGRTYPRSSIGALEGALGPLSDDGEVYTDPAERAIWEDGSLPEGEKRDLIAELRERRRRHDRRRHDRRAG
jgi:transcriptional regulator with XRE-family HTH domain